MGQRHSTIVPNPNDMDLSQWDEDIYLTGELTGMDFGQLKVMRNRVTEQLVDKYQMFFTTKKEFEYYVQSYKWRLQEKQIVKAYHLTPFTRSQYCSTTYQVDVYIEHPKNRLSDFKDIPHPDNLYCLTAMLKGFQKLYDHVGPFPICEQQICINEQGLVKVWLNRDLSKNYPEEYPIQPQNRDSEEEEADMVQEIIKVISENTDAQCEPEPTFYQFYQRHKKVSRIGFPQAFSLVDQYVQQTGTPAPDYFISVVQIYGDQDGLYELNDQNSQMGNSNMKPQSSRSHQLYQNNMNSSGMQGNPKKYRQNTDRSQKYSRPNSQGGISHKLSSFSSNIGNKQVNLYENQYTQQPNNAYLTNNDSNIWQKSQRSKRQSQNNFYYAEQINRHQNPLETQEINLYEPNIKRINTIEHEAVIRQQQLQRISANQSGAGFDNLSSEVNRIFKDSEPNRSMLSNISRNNHQAIRNSQRGPFSHVNQSGAGEEKFRMSQPFNKVGVNSEKGGNSSRRHSAHFPDNLKNSRYSNASRNSSRNIPSQHDNSHEILNTPQSQNFYKPAFYNSYENQTPYIGTPSPKAYPSSAQGFSFGRRGQASQTTRKFYDTIDEQVELDPQIAADLLVYIDSY